MFVFCLPLVMNLATDQRVSFGDLYRPGYLKMLSFLGLFFQEAVFEKSIGCLKLLLFFVFQQLEYFPAALPARDSNFTASQGLLSSSLYSTVM